MRNDTKYLEEMIMRKTLFKSLALAVTFVLLATTLAACDTGPTPTPIPTAAPTAAPPTPVALQKVTIALGYLPDVQFAPFYLALNKGYYKAEGLDVTLQNGIAPDLIKQLGDGTGDVNFAVVSGDELIPARLQGIPVIYAMTWYRQYPVAAVSIEGKGPALKS